jgi:hypothetical protein
LATFGSDLIACKVDCPSRLTGSSIKSDPKVAKTSSGNAFEDILYNSDSESDDDDEEDEQAAQKGRPIKPLAKGKGGIARADP